MFRRSGFLLVCQLHNIAEQFLKNSCCICCIGLMEYMEVVAHENSLSLRTTSWTNVIWSGIAEIRHICKKCIYFTNINLIPSGLYNIYFTHYFMAGFLNYVSLNSCICRKLFLMCEGRRFVQLSLFSTIFKCSGKLHYVDW
jgi:hypothetical protein